MRVVIRDAEWRVRRVDMSSDGGNVVACEGLSELVQGREAEFLDRLEDIRVLKPEQTALKDDLSSNFDASLLHLEALLRRSAPAGSGIYLGDRAALDRLEFQLEPAVQALKQPRQRILIADAVGLGKTLEAGILVSELIARGRGRRILVLATKAMLAQFQREFWDRFTIPLTRLDSVGLQRVRIRIPANHNPFHYFDRSIISIDTLKQDIEYRHYLEKAYWDIIIIDEAHNVAHRGSRSQRNRLATLLATRSDTMIMLSATPHDGKPESFASLMNMLDPTAIANPHDYSSEDFSEKGLVTRRFKKDVREELGANFPEREVKLDQVQASEAEEAAFDALMRLEFFTLDEGAKGSGRLFRTTLEKALFSSPAACLSMVKNRIDRLQRRAERVRDDETKSEMYDDIESLEAFSDVLERIGPDEFSKYQLLKRLLGRDLGWSPDDPSDRVVIFTESLATLDFLAEHLPKDLGLPKDAVATSRGDMADRDLMDVIERFNQQGSSLRLLISTDVASEGLNLHHQSHRLIHFDIPWSLMVFQQRNGRIDRYGQSREPQIHYLQTISGNSEVRGDQRVLEILVEKDETASKNLGDPSEFLGLFDEQQEVELVASAMEDGERGGTVADLFFGTGRAVGEDAENPIGNFLSKGRHDVSTVAQPVSIFEDELSFARTGLRWLRESGESVEYGIDGDVLWLEYTKDLEQRLKYLPPQVRPEDNEFRLTMNREVLEAEMQRVSAGEEAVWPQVQWLWPLHPVMEWLTDRSLHAFGRHTAPVLRLAGELAPDEHVFLIHGGYPNRRGYTLLQEWVAVRFSGGTEAGLVEWSDLKDRLGLEPGRLPNPGVAGSTEELERLLPSAVAAAKERLRTAREEFVRERAPELERLSRNLEALKGKHLQQLAEELERSRQFESVKAARQRQERERIQRLFADHQDWLRNTQSIEDVPFLQVVAVFTGRGA